MMNGIEKTLKTTGIQFLRSLTGFSVFNTLVFNTLVQFILFRITLATLPFVGGYIMSLRTPFRSFPVRPVDPTLLPRSYRSSAASSRRRYGPLLTASKTIVKLLFLGLVGLTLSVVLFAAFHQDSSVLLLGRIWTESWQPIVALVLTMAMLAAIEESFS